MGGVVIVGGGGRYPNATGTGYPSIEEQNAEAEKKRGYCCNMCDWTWGLLVMFVVVAFMAYRVKQSADFYVDWILWIDNGKTYGSYMTVLIVCFVPNVIFVLLGFTWYCLDDSLFRRKWLGCAINFFVLSQVISFFAWPIFVGSVYGSLGTSVFTMDFIIQGIFMLISCFIKSNANAYTRQYEQEEIKKAQEAANPTT